MAANLERGRAVYDAHCVVCHGSRGDGEGKVAAQFRRRPQSFRAGQFKFRSTPSGSLPLDEDLVRTLTRGIARTGMVPHDHLEDADRRAVVAYLKTFSARFERERPATPIPIPPTPARTRELVERGERVYRQAGCVDCHGEAGRGDGLSVPTLRDDGGQAVVPSDLNLSLRPFRSGPTAADLYRTIATGLGGTPMPAYADALEPEEIWAVVAFVEALPPETNWGGLPDGPGADLVRWRCSVCHAIDGPQLPRQDREGWTKTVDSMIRWGAPIRPAEREAVIQYLVRHFGPARLP